MESSPKYLKTIELTVAKKLKEVKKSSSELYENEQGYRDQILEVSTYST